MKLNDKLEDFKLIEEKLKPIKSSDCGFLGEDEKFEEVVRYDDLTLARFGMTHEQIAKKLQQLIDLHSEKIKGKKEDDEVRVDEKNGVKRIHWLGYQNCPFDDNSLTCFDYIITDVKTKRKINLSGLIPHLVGTHRFFEGKGTSYRLNPLEAMLVTGLVDSREAEDMLYGELKLDLKSKYFSTVSHSIETMYWFADRDFMPHILEFIKNIKESYKCENDFDTGCLTMNLINLSNGLPRDLAMELNPHIMGILDVLKSQDYSLTREVIERFRN